MRIVFEKPAIGQLCAAVSMVLLGVSTVVQGATIQSLSNPVADGTINTTGGNNVRSDWDGVTPYVSDSNESATVDWAAVYVAHDTDNFYLRYVMNSVTNEYGWIEESQHLFIDADQSGASGFNGALGIGADYMLQKTTLYAYSGSGGADWNWTSIGTLSFDDFPARDHEMTLPKTLIGSPGSFDFVLFSSGSEDYYPNGGNQGIGAGEWFTYTTVPEPASAGLAAVTMLSLLRRRRAR